MIGPPFNAAVLQKQPFQPEAYIAVVKPPFKKIRAVYLGGTDIEVFPSSELISYLVGKRRKSWNTVHSYPLRSSDNP